MHTRMCWIEVFIHFEFVSIFVIPFVEVGVTFLNQIDGILYQKSFSYFIE